MEGGSWREAHARGDEFGPRSYSTSHVVPGTTFTSCTTTFTIMHYHTCLALFSSRLALWYTIRYRLVRQKTHLFV